MRPTPDIDPADTASELEALIRRWQGGDRAAGDDLFARVDKEIRAVAAVQLRGERAACSLQPTDLANEAYLRLAGLRELSFEGRTHLRAMAGRVMRQVLVDQARRRGAARRGDGRARVEIELDQIAEAGQRTEVRVLEEALERLQKLDPRQARVVELRFFGGLSIEETAAALDLSTATVGREWRAARAWLKRELRHQGDETP